MRTAKSTARVDMSPAAVEARLRDLASMHALGMSLQKARVLGPARDVDRRPPAGTGGSATSPVPDLDTGRDQ